MNFPFPITLCILEMVYGGMLTQEKEPAMGMRLHQRLRSRKGPVPAKVGIASIFVPEGLPPDTWREEMRKIVRSLMVPPHPDLDGPCFLEVRDDRIWDVIHEVMQEN